MKDYAIHWFRRDLRVAGNEALQYLYKKYDGRVVTVFCFDKKFLSRKDFSVNRFQFFLETLKSLKNELKKIGSDLLVLDIGPDEGFEKLFKSLGDHLPAEITWNRDYEPFARKRDKRMEAFFYKKGIETHSFRDHLIIEPWELSKPKTTDPYKVFTPFSRMWLEIFDRDEIQYRLTRSKKSLTYLRKIKKGDYPKIFNLKWKSLLKSPLEDHLDNYIKNNGEKVTVEIPQTGSAAILKSLETFKKRVDSYSEKRDIPSELGTSRFSLYLKNGSLTTSQVITYLELNSYNKPKNSREKFLSELIWREFYYHILYHFDHVEKACFKSLYDQIKWENSKTYFKKWKEGKTGFPIVDAGMRELKKTGWMHNRVRMIVASFLIKDLLIDWKWGEKYFMEELLDGDLAPNNGGWQWAASTGCDAQPYFRIFNPWTQSKKFDPDGIYIKKYIPELSDLDSKLLHKPIVDHKTYPAPIVDHGIQRIKALELFENLK